MLADATQILSTTEDQYFTWTKTQEQTKEISCKLEEIDFKVIFNRGCYVYPVAYCPTPAVVSNSINISSEDARIKKLFQECLIKEQRELYRFPKDTNGFDSLELRFFPDEATLKNKLFSEAKQYASMSSPRYGIFERCTMS